MNRTSVSTFNEPVTIVVVLHDSARVVDACLRSFEAAAPRRGVLPLIVDNASQDDGADRAAAILGPDSVIRLNANDGFAAGLNAGLVKASTALIAVLNPDTIIPAGTLDALADCLELHPQAALIGPLVRDFQGRQESTVGHFPTLVRERNHAWMLDRLPGFEGRRARFPRRTSQVDWVSGCAWVLRAEAIRDVGLLDSGYFMYYEDVDYCRRLSDSGWHVLATPEAEVLHGIGQGSDGTSQVPADGGTAMVRYFEKFHPDVPPERVRRLLRRGWWLREKYRRLRTALGDESSKGLAERYHAAIACVEKD